MKEYNIPIAADTGSLDGKPIIIASDTIDKTQQHRNALADKIRNSDYTDEQLDKIEKMLRLILLYPHLFYFCDEFIYLLYVICIGSCCLTPHINFINN